MQEIVTPALPIIEDLEYKAKIGPIPTRLGTMFALFHVVFFAVQSANAVGAARGHMIKQPAAHRSICRS